MHTIRTMLTDHRARLAACSIAAVAAGLAATLPVHAQTWDDSRDAYWDRAAESDTAYEWEPGEGYHEEEWYDPSDWFDDDSTVDYEGMGYSPDYGYDDYGYGDYGYGYGYAGYDYDTYPYTGTYDYLTADSRRSDSADSYDYSSFGVEDEHPYGYGGYGYDDDIAHVYRDYDYGYRGDDWSYGDYWTYWSTDNADSDGRESRTRGDAMNRRSAGDRRGGGMQLEGRLQDWQRVRLEGQRDAHTLVRLRTQDGRSRIVNLGPNVELSRLNLDQGDRIAVQGTRGRINGREVIMAERVRIGDRTVRMDNWQPSRATGARHIDMNRTGQSQRQRSQLEGQLEAWQRKHLQGQPDAHTLVRLRLRDGRSAIVNLGPNVELQRLDLEKGDRIAVQGQRGTIDGRQVILADRIRIGDQTVRMDNWDPSSRMRNDRPMGESGRDMNRGQDRFGSGSAWRNDDRMRPDQGRMQQDSVRRAVSNWPDAARKTVQQMVEALGMPDSVSSRRIVWTDAGPFARTVVHNRSDQDGTRSNDVIEHFVYLTVPADKMDDLARFDESITVFRADGLTSARCQDKAMNVLALNLAHDIATGERTWQEARQKYEEAASAYRNGERPQITQRLDFDTSPQRNQRDAGNRRSNDRNMAQGGDRASTDRSGSSD